MRDYRRKLGMVSLAAAVILSAIPVSPAYAHSEDRSWSARMGSLLDRLEQRVSQPIPSPVVPGPSRPAQSNLLIGFGDSVAAGVGAGAADQVCGRTEGAYPGLAAARLGMEHVNVACSGGRAWDGIVTDQPVRDAKIRSQLLQAREYARPAVATITVGANDVKWNEWLAYCAYPGVTCGGEDGRRTFSTLLGRLDVQLTSALAGVAALGPEQILLTGYYDPFKGSTACLREQGISRQEAAWLSARLAEVNEKIQQVADRSRRAEFVPIDFGTRGFCSLDPLVLLPNEPGAFHPNTEGQRVIAEAVARAARQ